MTSVCPFQEKRIVNMAIVALPIQVMILVSLIRLLFYAVRKRCQDTGIFDTIIILCRSQALSTLISDFSN